MFIFFLIILKSRKKIMTQSLGEIYRNQFNDLRKYSINIGDVVKFPKNDHYNNFVDKFIKRKEDVYLRTISGIQEAKENNELDITKLIDLSKSDLLATRKYRDNLYWIDTQKLIRISDYINNWETYINKIFPEIETISNLTKTPLDNSTLSLFTIDKNNKIYFLCLLQIHQGKKKLSNLGGIRNNNESNRTAMIRETCEELSYCFDKKETFEKLASKDPVTKWDETDTAKKIVKILDDWQFDNTRSSFLSKGTVNSLCFVSFELTIEIMTRYQERLLELQDEKLQELMKEKRTTDLNETKGITLIDVEQMDVSRNNIRYSGTFQKQRMIIRGVVDLIIRENTMSTGESVYDYFYDQIPKNYVKKNEIKKRKSLYLVSKNKVITMNNIPNILDFIINSAFFNNTYEVVLLKLPDIYPQLTKIANKSSGMITTREGRNYYFYSLNRKNFLELWSILKRAKNNVGKYENFMQEYITWINSTTK